WVRKLYNSRLTLRLSNAALEVLSIIAFKQPITKAEIEAIRGVDSSGPIDTLIERKLVTNIGRKETLGRPIMYGTTEEFLKQFGLNSLEDLPALEGLVSQDAIKNIDDKIKSAEKEKAEDNSKENLESVGEQTVDAQNSALTEEKQNN
ncbi:MAG TPA: SMC-Scp complex subunit ScpB, partial [Elusimicrobiales bacterium]|nr:SMC-Scp complex subunit ScpB [Elusimicrobiales bacterium]